jgi:hypothetical protein
LAGRKVHPINRTAAANLAPSPIRPNVEAHTLLRQVVVAVINGVNKSKLRKTSTSHLTQCMASQRKSQHRHMPQVQDRRNPRRFKNYELVSVFRS